MSKDESKVPKIVHQEVTREERFFKYHQRGLFIAHEQGEINRAELDEQLIFSDALRRLIENCAKSFTDVDKCKPFCTVDGLSAYCPKCQTIEVSRERMLATLATLLRVYVESERRIPELERDLKDGAVIAIRALIESHKVIREPDEQVDPDIISGNLRISISEMKQAYYPSQILDSLMDDWRSKFAKALTEAGVEVEK